MFAQKSSCSIYVIGNRPRAVKSCESIDSKFRSLTRKLFSNFSISSLNQNRTTFSLFMPCFSVHDFYRSDAISADKCLSSRNLLAAFSKVEKPLKSIVVSQFRNRAQLQTKSPTDGTPRWNFQFACNNSFIRHHTGEIYCF